MNIEAMKNQTFGVEIEMYMCRLIAAQVAADFFGTSYIYVGGEYEEYKVPDRKGRYWSFKMDQSIEATEKYQTELVTPILFYDDIELLQRLVRRLRTFGAKSNPSRCCGVHVHVGADGHTAQSLMNLSNAMAGHEDLLIRALDLDEDRLDEYCAKTTKLFLWGISGKRDITMKEFREIWYRSHGSYDEESRQHHYNNSRYHMLNLHSVFYRGTIEFRLFQFDEPDNDDNSGIHAGQLKAYIQFCLAFSQYAKECKYCKVDIKCNRKFERTLHGSDHDLTTMRNWLNLLGLTGKEFETCRYFFTKRFTKKVHTYLEATA